MTKKNNMIHQKQQQNMVNASVNNQSTINQSTTSQPPESR